jgi:PIN domain nuclease of toxin-antitoxin system
VIAYLDTQLVIWLCQNQRERLTNKAVQAMEESDLLISPMVLLELEYLHEIKRVVPTPQALLNQLETQIGLRVCDQPFPPIVQTAIFETWTRDPFDRLIVAHAKANRYSPLITSDSRIRKHYSRTVW